MRRSLDGKAELKTKKRDEKGIFPTSHQTLIRKKVKYIKFNEIVLYGNEKAFQNSFRIKKNIENQRSCQLLWEDAVLN